MQAYLATFTPKPHDRILEHVHEGAEFLYILDGQLAVQYADEETILRPGDSAYFDGSQPHGYRALNNAEARAVVITTPPRL